MKRTQTHSLLSHPGATEFLLEFQEEHLSELAFLLPKRRQYLLAPSQSWTRAAATERRIRAQLVAARAGGPLSLDCASGWLNDGDSGQAMAATLLLASLPPELGGWAELVRVLQGDSVELWPAWEEGLALAEGGWVAEQLTALLSSPHSQVRSRSARLLGWRREGEATCFVDLLEDPASEVRGAAALALGKWSDLAVRPILERRLPAVPDSELAPWLTGALLLGSSLALSHLRELCGRAMDVPPGCLLLLALAGDGQDIHRLRQRCRWSRPEEAREAVEALGVLGIPAAVPTLMEGLNVACGPVRDEAALALELITGAGLTEQVPVAAPDDEDAPVALATRPETRIEMWRGWWKKHEGRFDARRRYRRGRPFEVGCCIDELEAPHSPFALRARAALELSIRAARPGASLSLEPDWPVVRQQGALAHLREVIR